MVRREISGVHNKAGRHDIKADDGDREAGVNGVSRVKLLGRAEAAKRQGVKQAQQWRGGRVPQWAVRVPESDLEEARAVVAAKKSGRALYDAAEAGKEGEAKALIAAGAKVNWKKKEVSAACCCCCCC